MDTSKLDTDGIRQLYHHWTDEEPFGYKNDDRIGWAILGTVKNLCNEVDRLRAELDKADGVCSDLAAFCGLM